MALSDSFKFCKNYELLTHNIDFLYNKYENESFILRRQRILWFKSWFVRSNDLDTNAWWTCGLLTKWYDFFFKLNLFLFYERKLSSANFWLCLKNVEDLQMASPAVKHHFPTQIPHIKQLKFQTDVLNSAYFSISEKKNYTNLLQSNNVL